jgi:hypothetical protein
MLLTTPEATAYRLDTVPRRQPASLLAARFVLTGRNQLSMIVYPMMRVGAQPVD